MAKIGTQGTVIEVEDSVGSGTFTAIAAVSQLTDNPQAPPEIDVTDVGSTAREFLGGLIDFGNMSGTVFHDPSDASHALLNSYALNASTQVPAWRIILPAQPVQGWFGFNGYVQIFGMPGSIGVDTALTSNLTIRKSGNVVFTAGAAP